MIEFSEGQDSIYASGKKITPSEYDGYVNVHIRCEPDSKSGYEGKFVRVIAIDRSYNIDDVKAINSNSLDNIQGIKYFENGGYQYDRKTY